MLERVWRKGNPLTLLVGMQTSTPLRYSCLENLTNRGAWWATVHRVAKSWTRLKQLCSITHVNESPRMGQSLQWPLCKLESTLAAWPFRKNVSEPWSQKLWLFTYLHPHSNLLSYMRNWSVRKLICHLWSSVTAQFVKNLSAMLKTLLGFLVWEDPLEKG